MARERNISLGPREEEDFGFELPEGFDLNEFLGDKGFPSGGEGLFEPPDTFFEQLADPSFTPDQFQDFGLSDVFSLFSEEAQSLRGLTGAQISQKFFGNTDFADFFTPINEELLGQSTEQLKGSAVSGFGQLGKTLQTSLGAAKGRFTTGRGDISRALVQSGQERRFQQAQSGFAGAGSISKSARSARRAATFGNRSLLQDLSSQREGAQNIFSGGSLGLTRDLQTGVGDIISSLGGQLRTIFDQLADARQAQGL